MKTALVIIDLQKKFVLANPGMRSSAKMHMGTINRTARKFREKNEPVILMKTDCPIESYMYAGPDSEDLLDDLITDKNDIVLHKVFSNSFHGTDLDKILHDQNCKRIILTGLTTQYCILSTYCAAYDLGFDPYLLEDGTITMDESVNDAAKKMCQTIDANELDGSLS